MAFTIAVDGPAASGKGTISRALAEQLGLAHLDTGLLYRAVAAATLQGATPVAAARALAPSDLENEDFLRTAEIAQEASKVAVISEVRAALLDFQRAFARRQGGAVLDGRDIGTIICPEAEVKLFVTASAEVRARRRYRELAAKGHDVTPEGVLEDVQARDARDMNRSDAPLKAAAGAVSIDTSDMSITDAIEAALALARPAFDAAAR
ncbi:(d)CMP kinase [Primorskyibacter sp. S187A]|uniref:(d)CMP kinase n=1 Tax=Primorskyibacter sp. S187A TaxID=3415130 RepID=UPI003C7AA801